MGKGLYREAPREGMPYAVRSTHDAAQVEAALTVDGRCNFLTSYESASLEWCGAPVRGEVCEVHFREMKGML